MISNVSMISYSERARGVSGSSPAPTTVQAKALISDNLEDTTAPESLGVCLALDLEDIQRQQNDLTNTDQTRERQSTATGVASGEAGIRLTCQRWSA